MELVAKEMERLLLGTAPIGVEQFLLFKGQLMETIAQVLRADRDSDERTAMKLNTLELMRTHMWIPTAATVVYVVMVHTLPLVVKHRGPLPLGWLLAAWNFFLATFSLVGAAHCVRCLVANVLSTGWRYSICTHPTVIALQVHFTSLRWLCNLTLLHGNSPHSAAVTPQRSCHPMLRVVCALCVSSTASGLTTVGCTHRAPTWMFGLAILS